MRLNCCLHMPSFVSPIFHFLLALSPLFLLSSLLHCTTVNSTPYLFSLCRPIHVLLDSWCSQGRDPSQGCGLLGHHFSRPFFFFFFWWFPTLIKAVRNTTRGIRRPIRARR